MPGGAPRSRRRRTEASRRRSVRGRCPPWSQSKVANIETAVSAVNRRDLELLLDLYEVTDEDEFFEPAAAARKQMPRATATGLVIVGLVAGRSR